MATMQSTPYDYSTAKSTYDILGATTPVAIGPVPTPIPPTGVNYTPQYSGSQSFTTTTPQSYSTGLPTGPTTSQPTTTQPTQQIPSSQAKSSGPSDLVSALVSKGYNLQDALNAANGPNADALRREYLTASNPAQTYNIRGTNVTAPSGKEALSSVLPESDYSQFANLYNPEEFLRSIDTEYGAQSDVLNQQENALRAAQEAFNKTLESEYSASVSKMGVAKASTKGKLAENKVQAEQQRQDALNSARRLYNELQQGYRQRFGGATSAGEAAQSILGAEQQRQSGGIQQSFGNAVRDIQRQDVELENTYNTQLQELEANKQRAVAETQNNFMSNLNRINSNRASSLQAREQAKRQVLLDNRNALAQIEQSKIAQAQQLQLMREQQKMSLQTQAQQLSQQTQGFQNAGLRAVSNIPTQVSSQIGQNNKTVSTGVMQSTPQIQSSTGYIAPRSYQGQMYDQFGNLLTL